MESINNINCYQSKFQFPWHFFLFTFLFSWIIYLPAILQVLGYVNFGISSAGFTLLNVLGGFCPSIIGLLCIYKEQGKSGFIRVLKSLYKIKKIERKWINH